MAATATAEVEVLGAPRVVIAGGHSEEQLGAWKEAVPAETVGVPVAQTDFCGYGVSNRVQLCA